MSWEKLNERPSRGLLSWNVAYKDEPRKGAPAVDVDVWIPKEVVRAGIGDIADYLEARLGWKVHRNGGWSGGGLMLGPDELTIVTVKVRAREIRAALTGGGAAAVPPPVPPQRSPGPEPCTPAPRPGGS